MTRPDNPSHIARAELDPGERLVWTGRPGAAAQPGWQLDLKPLVLGAPAAVVAAILLAQGLPPDSLIDVALLLGTAVVLALAAWQLSTPLRQARALRQTVYAITDRRLFILEPSPRRLRNFAPQGLDEPELRERGGGAGDVIFAVMPERERTRSGERLRLKEAAFIDIPAAHEVAQEIARLKARAAERPVVAESEA